jgi:pimeloyl-ACP methyl ester carboxylesterase
MMNSSSLESEFDLTNDLVNMKVPFLVLIGENDLAFPPQKQKELFNVVDNLTFVTIPGIGHSTERIDLILPHIKEFLTSVNKGT